MRLPIALFVGTACPLTGIMVILPVGRRPPVPEPRIVELVLLVVLLVVAPACPVTVSVFVTVSVAVTVTLLTIDITMTSVVMPPAPPVVVWPFDSVNNQPAQQKKKSCSDLQ